MERIYHVLFNFSRPVSRPRRTFPDTCKSY